MVHSLVGFEAGGQVQRNKRDPKINSQRAVSPHWGSGKVPGSTGPSQGKC